MATLGDTDMDGDTLQVEIGPEMLRRWYLSPLDDVLAVMTCHSEDDECSVYLSRKQIKDLRKVLKRALATGLPA